MESRRLFLEGKRTDYLVYEDGRVWSELRGGRFLSAQVNSAGYLLYNMTKTLGKAYMAHTFVLLMFIGDSPGKGYECNHKDLDKRNNHWSNLEWVTHSYNLIHARKAKHWEPGRRGFHHSKEVKAKMAKAKYKEIRCFNDNKEEMLFSSIEDFLKYFRTYRKKFNRIVCSGRKIDGWYVLYANKEDNPLLRGIIYQPAEGV